jgi:TRAP-type C4-dicarboxylate transport system substrate-binding protein
MTTTPRMISRRPLILSSLAAPFILSSGPAHAETVLKISHQAPGGTIDKGDIRDRMALRFLAEIEKRTNGAVKAQNYPASSLVKPTAQYSAMRKGALDMSLFPISAAGGETPELNIGLMPCLVPSYEAAYGWKQKPIGRELTRVLQDKGIVVVSWLWLSGGLVSKTQAVDRPDSVKGMKIRGGSREMDMVLKAAGAAVISLPSTELYQSMQTGACDACITSASSIQSFRLQEVAKSMTFGNASIWFIFGPLLMSKMIFEGLPKAHQDVIMEIGAELEPFGLAGARSEDQSVIDAFGKANIPVKPFSRDGLDQWAKLAEETAWKDYSAKSDTCAQLLKLARDAGA